MRDFLKKVVSGSRRSVALLLVGVGIGVLLQGGLAAPPVVSGWFGENGVLGGAREADASVAVLNAGTVQGNVTSLPGRSDLTGISVELAGGGQTYATSTDATGYYQITGVAPWVYTLTLRMPGYLFTRKTGIPVNDGQTTTLPGAALAPGDLKVDNNNKIDLFDLILLGGNWQKTAPTNWSGDPSVITSTATPTPLATATPSVSSTATVTPTATGTPGPSATPTTASTATNTPGPSATPTATSTMTPTPTPTVGPISVTIVDFAFQPSSVTIAAGQSVKWTNNDPFAHTSTSDNSVWNSGDLGSGQSFTVTFNTAGSYGYHCAIHTSMTGTVAVSP